MNLVNGDCLIEMPNIPNNSIDLVFVDPPYNIGKAEWDKIDDYMGWCALWIVECSRVLKPNGAFWISHSKPLVLAQLSGMIKGRGLRNWITWDKLNGNPAIQAMGGPMIGATMMTSARSWQPMAEYLIYHADEGEWTSQCDKERGFIFEPLRAYLDGERKRADVPHRKVIEALGMRGHDSHFFSPVQWKLPLPNQYDAMRRLFNASGNEYLKREYEYLKREYEDLRAEFENLRCTFNNPGKMSSVWQIPPAKTSFHATPKPVELMRRIIESTSNEGDTVLDPMMGSGTTGVACINLKREFIGIELDEKYFDLAQKRIREINAQMRLDLDRKSL